MTVEIVHDENIGSLSYRVGDLDVTVVYVGDAWNVLLLSARSVFCRYGTYQTFLAATSAARWFAWHIAERRRIADAGEQALVPSD